MDTDRKNLAIGGLVGALLAALGVTAYESKQVTAPAPQPPAPVVVPACSLAHCNGACSRPAPQPRPFGVVCPFCRNSMTVVPPASGATGKVVGEVTKP